MKIHALAVELFHADGRTDMTKLIVAIRNFANAPKKIGGGGHLPTSPPPLSSSAYAVSLLDIYC